jgi:hypothetical protein
MAEALSDDTLEAFAKVQSSEYASCEKLVLFLGLSRDICLTDLRRHINQREPLIEANAAGFLSVQRIVQLRLVRLELRYDCWMLHGTCATIITLLSCVQDHVQLLANQENEIVEYEKRSRKAAKRLQRVQVERRLQRQMKALQRELQERMKRVQVLRDSRNRRAQEEVAQKKLESKLKEDHRLAEELQKAAQLEAGTAGFIQRPGLGKQLRRMKRAIQSVQNAVTNFRFNQGVRVSSMYIYMQSA